jgi:hypothetical protein
MKLFFHTFTTSFFSLKILVYMKQILIAFCLVVLLQPASMAQTAWKDANYKPVAYRNVMVLAKVTDKNAKQQLEAYTVKLLTDKGIAAIPAYSYPQVSKVNSREEFLVLADSLKVDALLVYEVNGAEKRVEQTPTVSVGVGVGMYGGYVGASTPIAGGAKMVATVKMSTYFYNRDSKDEQWALDLSGTLDGATDKLAYTFSKTVVKAMMKDGMFVTKK